MVRFQGMINTDMVINIHPTDSTAVREASQEHLQNLLLGFHQTVFLCCLGFARNQAEAQDLTQDTFIKAFQHLDQVPPNNPRAWLLCIARNACIDQHRRQKVRRLFMPWLAPDERDARTPDQHLGQQEEIALVRKAIQGLSQPLREVLVLREYNDLSYQEIAEVLHLNQGTVMSRLNRAKKAVLRHHQEKHHGKQTR